MHAINHYAISYIQWTKKKHTWNQRPFYGRVCLTNCHTTGRHVPLEVLIKTGTLSSLPVITRTFNGAITPGSRSSGSRAWWSGYLAMVSVYKLGISSN